MDLKKAIYKKKNIYYEDRVNGLKDVNKRLQKENKQLKEIIKTIFEYCESDIWRNSNYVRYTPKQKQLIINILKGA